MGPGLVSVSFLKNLYSPNDRCPRSYDKLRLDLRLLHTLRLVPTSSSWIFAAFRVVHQKTSVVDVKFSFVFCSKMACHCLEQCNCCFAPLAYAELCFCSDYLPQHSKRLCLPGTYLRTLTIVLTIFLKQCNILGFQLKDRVRGWGCSQPSCKLLSTHDDMSIVNKIPSRASVVTNMRNPVDRVLSTYEFSVEVAARFLRLKSINTSLTPLPRAKSPSQLVSTLTIWPWKYLVPFMQHDIFGRVK